MLKLLLLCLVTVVTCVPVHHDVTHGRDELCGYDSCKDHDPNFLNVHIVAHTHDDVGWLKTVDEYYYGSRNNIQKAGVQYILDSVIKELWEDPKRKFVYIETAFFWKWWTHQPESVREKVHTLVRQGRLQFAGGAWSMNDEAAVHYQSTIDQFTWGLSKLNETFGKCGRPHVGWQIDPFGHSREFASLLASMGYDGLFLGRIDYQDKVNRLGRKTMEMLWRGDDDLGKSSDIFTGILYNTYSPPPGFCFDVLCSDEPIIDDPNSPIFNVDKRVSDFLNYTLLQSAYYRTNNVLLTMGGDFTYQDAGMWYRNLDRLIEYANIKSAQDGLNIKLFYSTPNCYLKAVKEANPTLPTKQDDFFPYSSDPNSFWTGYFTSRPTTKYFEREANSYLQMVKQLQVLANLEEHNQFVINELRSAMGVMQHHDAITGTEKQQVTYDYVRMLNVAVDDALIVARQALNKYLQGDALKPPILSFDRCHFNESSCYTSENSDQFIISVYNHLAWEVNEIIRIPVMDGNYEVYAPNGEEITTQLVDIPSAVTNIPTRKSKATHEIFFIAKLHPLSYKTFYIRKVHTHERSSDSIVETDTNRKLNEHNRLKRATYTNDKANGYWKANDNIEDSKIFVSNDKNTYWNAEIIDFNDGDMAKKTFVPVYEVNDVKNDVEFIDASFDDYVDNTKDIDKLVEIINGHKKGKFIHEEVMMGDDAAVVTSYPEDSVIENEYIKLRVNPNGEVTSMSRNDMDIRFAIQFSYYHGVAGNNEIASNRSSGAYIFRPIETEPRVLNFNTTVGPNGPVVKEVRMNFEENVHNTIRIYDGLNFLETEWVVGPIDVSQNIGKEFVVKYISDLVNNGEFYTDSNGRQSLKRKLNLRPQFNITLQEPVSGNYYPITNKIYINGEKHKLAVLTDRSQGGSSLSEGEIEVMLHRRLLHDDAFGVGEALNEEIDGKGLVVRGKHRLLLSNADSKTDCIEEKRQVLQFHLQPITLVADADKCSFEDWMKLPNKEFIWGHTLPDGVHLLTLEPWGGKNLLLRLENYLEIGDRDNTVVEVDLTKIFKTIAVKSVKETMLGGNLWADEYKKWSWNKEERFSLNFNEEYGEFNEVEKSNDVEEEINDDGMIVKVKAKQIRTFVVSFDYV